MPRVAEPTRHDTLRLGATLEARIGEKVSDDLKVLLWLLPKCHVAARAEGDPPRSPDTVKQGSDAGILHLVVGAVEDQRRAGHGAQLGDDGPVFERARHVELVDSEPAMKNVQSQAIRRGEESVWDIKGVRTSLCRPSGLLPSRPST